MTWRAFIVRLIIFAVPGVFLLAGGISAPRKAVSPARGIGDLIFEQIYPDNWAGLLACAVLICLPGACFYLASEYLADLPAWNFHPLKSTPEAIWRAVGYVVAIIAAALALRRWMGC